MCFKANVIGWGQEKGGGAALGLCLAKIRSSVFASVGRLTPATKFVDSIAARYRNYYNYNGIKEISIFAGVGGYTNENSAVVHVWSVQ